MGTFGTAISSNDIYADVYADFFDLYNDGHNVAEISQKLIVKNRETINDPDDAHNFWFALAKAQWECKQLDADIYNHVKKIIESDADLEVWRQLDATEKDIAKRKEVLQKFLTTLQTERPKVKPRKKKVILQPLFAKGDCLTFKLKNGNYGGAVVLEEVRDTQFGLNLIVVTRINQPDKPLIANFENAEVQIMNFGNWNNQENIGWYNPMKPGYMTHTIEKVGNIYVSRNYNYKEYKYSYGGFHSGFIDRIDLQFEFEKENPKSTKKVSIKQLTKKCCFFKTSQSDS